MTFSFGEICTRWKTFGVFIVDCRIKNLCKFLKSERKLGVCILHLKQMHSVNISRTNNKKGLFKINGHIGSYPAW